MSNLRVGMVVRPLKVAYGGMQPYDGVVLEIQPEDEDDSEQALVKHPDGPERWYYSDEVAEVSS